MFELLKRLAARLVGWRPPSPGSTQDVDRRHRPPVQDRIHTLVFESRASADRVAEMLPWH